MIMINQSTPFKEFMTSLRKKTRSTQKQMAIKLNITNSFLSSMESGIKPIPIEYIDKIISIYHLDSNEAKELARSIYETNRYLIVDINDSLWQEILNHKVAML